MSISEQLNKGLIIQVLFFGEEKKIYEVSFNSFFFFLVSQTENSSRGKFVDVKNKKNDNSWFLW